MTNVNRRDFMTSTAGAAAAGALGFSVKTHAGSANDTVRVAVVGINGQGKAHISAYSKMPNVEIAAYCDVDESVLAKRCQEAEAGGRKKPQTFTDVRKL